MIWSTFFVLAIPVATLMSGFRTSTLVPLMFLASIFVIDSPLLPGLSTMRMALLLASFGLIIRPLRLPKGFLTLMVIMVGYVLLLSIANLDLDIPNWGNIQLGNLQRPPLRNIFSTAVFLFSMLAFILGAQVTDCEGVTTKLMGWYINFAIIAGIFALFQVFMNIFSPSLNGFFALFSKGLILEGSGLVRVRPSPFVYEPRYFAMAMGIGTFLLLLKEKEYLIPMRLYTRMATISLFLILILFSASTSAILAIGFGFATVRLVKLKNKRGMRGLFLVVAIGVGLFLVAKSLNLLVFDRFIIYINRASASYSTGDGLAQLGVLAYVDWLRNIPMHELLIGKGLGNSAYFAFDYLSTSSELFRNGFFSARINIFDMIGDMGLIGFFYIQFLWLYLLGQLRENRLSESWRARLRMLKLFCYFLIGVNFLFRSYTLVWLILGLSWRCYHQGMQAGTDLREQKTVSPL